MPPEEPPDELEGGGGEYAGIPPDMGSGLGAMPGGWGGIAAPPPQLESELQKLPYALKKAEHVVTPLKALVEMLGHMLVYEERAPEETREEAAEVQPASPAEPRLPNWVCIV